VPEIVPVSQRAQPFYAKISLVAPPRQFAEQLDSVLTEYESMQAQSRHRDLSDLPKDRRQSLATRVVAAVHRISGRESAYSKDIARLVAESPAIHGHLPGVIGVARALKADIEAGCLDTLIELVHASVFANFLDMAAHLHEAGYKDPSAVLTGSTLESHLRELCKKHGVSFESGGKPKRADLLNAELTKAGAYSGLDQKNVAAWLGLRNKAAHGDYDQYSGEQVALMIAAVRDFLIRNPA
jgi:hypothetical protein